VASLFYSRVLSFNSSFSHAMLIGYVSDENFSALVDVVVEFEQNGRSVAVVRSSPRGAIHADLSAGSYQVTFAKPGFGSKRVAATVIEGKPCHFRLLSDSLYGYVWPKWSRSGEPGEFRVHSPEPYHCSLWRYGFEKELIKKIGWFDEHGPRTNVQILPDGDFTQSGVGWNRLGYGWKPSAPEALHYCKAQTVTAPERSGLYYFHVETESQKFLSFPWVIAPSKPTARIAVIASTNTWNAYNNFGGRSNYINSTELPPEPTVNARLDLSRYSGQLASVWQWENSAYAPLSFDRPEPFNNIPKDTLVIDPIRGRQPCHLAPAEWRLLGWLEREGFDYDLYSDYQLHAGQLDLDAYQILIISTHPEYWSRDAYMLVKKWVFERGGRLLYLGGNGIDCEVELPGIGTMRCKTWQPRPAGSSIFTEPGTGKTYDCRFHYTVESPAELLGVVFTEAGAATAAPYKVIDSSHWIFEGTELRDGDIFGTESLHERIPGGASGHEQDKRTPHSPKNSVLLARGLNIDNGGAEIIVHETKTGGAVFSVGSITWPACVLVDEATSKITRNVIKRFLEKRC
jgi:N,N-dimethylformamidase